MKLYSAFAWLTDWGVLQASGPKVTDFLQGQLTCDVRELNEKKSCFGAYCDVKGRIQASFYLFFDQASYYFLLPKRVIPYLKNSLKKYAVFSATSLIDVTEHWGLLGLAEPLSHDISLPSSSQLIRLAGPSSRAVLAGPIEYVKASLTSPAQPLTLNDWHCLDICSGLATIYPETIGLFTPHQLNYPSLGAVSFTKGCYLGQEVIARTHYLGKPKIQLYRISFQCPNPIRAGTSLQNDTHTRQGTLVASAYQENSTYQGLACLQIPPASPNIYLPSPTGPVFVTLLDSD